MSNLRLWLKQRFCTHYHIRHNKLISLYDLYPRRVIMGVGIGGSIRIAKNDPDAVKCLNCGLRYFDTDGRGFLL